MRFQDLPSTIRRRFKRPATWGAVILFAAVWLLVRLATGIPVATMGIGEVLIPMLMLAGHITLGPLPWQWTGDERPLAPPWQGCLQALPWNAAWIGMVVLLVHGMLPSQPPRPAPPPPLREERVEPQRSVVTEPAVKETSPPQEPPPSPATTPPAPAPSAPDQPRSEPAPAKETEPPAQDPAQPPHRPGEEPRPRPERPRPGERPDGPRPGPGDPRFRPPRPNQRPDAQGRPVPQLDRSSLTGSEALRPSNPVSTAGLAWLTLPTLTLAQVGPQPAPDPLALERPDPGAPPPREGGPSLPDRRPDFILLVLNLPFAMVLGWILAEKERAEATEDGLQELARQARSRALQAQLHPHALYNVLSGLTELVHEDPDAAEEALVQLTELLRMLTRQAAATSLPLSQERDLLRHYLAIEAIRLGPRLSVEWNWPDWADPISLPPLLLQPLVENAIKHGISPHPDGGVLRIGIFRSDRDLIFRIANTGQSLNPGQAEGTGMRNLRERLSLLGEYHPSLELRSDGPWTVVELRLNLSMKGA